MKFTKYRLAAGLNRSPDPLAAIRGPTSKGREGRGEEGKGRGEGRGEKGRGELAPRF